MIKLSTAKKRLEALKRQNISGWMIDYWEKIVQDLEEDEKEKAIKNSRR